VTITRKVPRPLDHDAAAKIVRDLSLWDVHSPDPADILGAITRHAGSGISFWDAMMIQSAAALGYATLHTEDLSADQVIDGVRIDNLFS
jgi:predicted nucleic acid-binding protein